jgi:hypothetical protein
VAIYPEKTAANARRFLSSLIEAAPFRLHTILTEKMVRRKTGTFHKNSTQSSGT